MKKKELKKMVRKLEEREEVLNSRIECQNELIESTLQAVVQLVENSLERQVAENSSAIVMDIEDSVQAIINSKGKSLEDGIKPLADMLLTILDVFYSYGISASGELSDAIQRAIEKQEALAEKESR